MLKKSTGSTPRSTGSIRAMAGKFRIFKGIESDILPDGSLDYPDEVLRRFDFIVASVHGQFRMDRAKADRAHPARGAQSLRDHPRPHDRPTASAAAGL